VSFFFVHSVLSQEDSSIGDFQVDTDNDPPFFVDWLDQEDTVSPYTSVLFYATILDIDNSSTELNVTLWYSNDSFSSVNVSVSMSYDSHPAANQWHFTYTFPGQAADTYYKYYYTVFDGNTTVKEDDNSNYYDIQWLKVASGGTAYDPPGETPVGVSPEIIINPDVVLGASLIAFILCSLFVILGYDKSRKIRGSYLPEKNLFFDKRIYGGIIGFLFLSIMITTSFSSYTTFNYDGATLEWKIDSSGIVNTSDIYQTIDDSGVHYFTRYSLIENASFRGIEWDQITKTDVDSDIAFKLHDTIYISEISYTQAIWIKTSVRSSNIKVYKANMYNKQGTLVREYEHSSLLSDTYEFFLYRDELRPYVIGDGVFIRYYGSYSHDSIIDNIFLNVYFDINIS